MQCKDCRFYVGHTAELKRGDCRAHPPHPSGFAPIVPASYWCGEFQPKQQVEER